MSSRAKVDPRRVSFATQAELAAAILLRQATRDSCDPNNPESQAQLSHANTVYDAAFAGVVQAACDSSNTATVANLEAHLARHAHD